MPGRTEKRSSRRSAFWYKWILLDHLPQLLPLAEPRTLDIDILYALEIFQLSIARRYEWRRDGCIVHCVVDPPKLVHDALERHLDLLLIAYVCRAGQEFDARDLGLKNCCRLRQTTLRNVKASDASNTIVGELEHDGATQGSAGTSYKGDSVLHGVRR
jgi:hypothetical protein